MLYSNNNKRSYKLKHVDIKFLVVKEKVQSGKIVIEPIRTNSIIVGLLKKGLPPKVFHEHTIHMGVVSIDDMWFQWEFVFRCHLVVNTFYGYFL